MSDTIYVPAPTGDPDKDTDLLQRAFDGAPAGALVQLPLTRTAYAIRRTLVVKQTITLRGYNRYGSVLLWVGDDPEANLLLVDTGVADNFSMYDLSIQNAGQCGNGVLVKLSQRVIFERLNSVSPRPFKTAILQTDTQGTVYDIVMRDCLFAVQSGTPGQSPGAFVTPIAVALATGHTHVIDHCMFSGFKTAVLVGQSPSVSHNTVVNGFSIVNSRIETFSGTKPDPDSGSISPGDPAAIGIDLFCVTGVNISGNNFEMNGDETIDNINQCAIVVRDAQGGLIAGNSITGHGKIPACAIEFRNSTAKGFVIQGNAFLDIPNPIADISGDASQKFIEPYNYSS